MTEVLPDRDDGDDGGLREDVADVDRLQKIRGRLTDHCDEQDQAQERADGEKAKGEPDRERPAGATLSWRGSHLLRGTAAPSRLANR